MGAVQFALKGDDKKKKILTYNEKQRIYNEQNQIIKNYYNSKNSISLEYKYNYKQNI